MSASCIYECMRSRNRDSCIGLDFGVSGTILDNIITYVHTIHGPCSYFQYEPFEEYFLLVLIEKVNKLRVQQTFLSVFRTDVELDLWRVHLEECS